MKPTWNRLASSGKIKCDYCDNAAAIYCKDCAQKSTVFVACWATGCKEGHEEQRHA